MTLEGNSSGRRAGREGSDCGGASTCCENESLGEIEGVGGAKGPVPVAGDALLGRVKEGSLIF